MKKSSKILLNNELQFMEEIRDTIYKYNQNGVFRFSNGVIDLVSNDIQDILRIYSNVLPEEVEQFYKEKQQCIKSK